MLNKIKTSIYCYSFLMTAAFLLTTLTGCEADESQNLEERNFRLVWSDEFDGEAGTLPNPENWTYDIGTGNNGWGNAELQYYTDNPSNVSLDGNGNLLITARRESFGGQPFTSARIKTEGLFEQTYGRFEARLKAPVGPGVWPAFWLLGNNCAEEPWPQCGEIDVMELRGQAPNKIAGSLHGPGYNAGRAITTEFSLENEGRFDTDFRVFAIEWSEDKVDYFVDDFLYQRIEREDVPGEWVYDHPFFMILNVAIGGNYVGFPTSETPLPQSMVIDYVRVFAAE
ncbi:glycosyl hydrolase family 16 [Lewinellaceae bacterium SD302]|nr:glycosyl hydrolase family 16 [Lewinellaceae bacterium SD302]